MIGGGFVEDAIWKLMGDLTKEDEADLKERHNMYNNCPKCGGKCWSNEEDGLVCVYCGYIKYKPIPECIKKEAKQSRNGRPDNCR